MALALLLVLSVRCWSQTSYCVDQNATPIDSISVDVALGSSSQIISEIWVTRSAGGQIQYVVNPQLIYFSGDGSKVDAMSTTQIFDLVAQAAVSEGISLGYTSCPGSCTSPATAIVRIPACVLRTGTGILTHFTVCSGSGCCVRVYDVCCPNGAGAPSVTLSSSSSPGCSPTSGCESTCP